MSSDYEWLTTNKIQNLLCLAFHCHTKLGLEIITSLYSIKLNKIFNVDLTFFFLKYNACSNTKRKEFNVNNHLKLPNFIKISNLVTYNL